MSPASSSETGTRWRNKKRKTHPPGLQPPPSPENDDVDDDDDEEEDDDDNQPQFQLQNSQSSPPIGRENELLYDGGVRISEFPTVVKRAVNRPHASVLSVVALERKIQSGERKSLQNGVVLENVSHGQLQALSVVPAGSSGLLAAGEQDKATTAAYVMTPPQIVEGGGVVKRFGSNRVLAVPMHADWFSPSTVNRLERQVVPHFFSGESAENTPEKYMACRNQIVAKYVENPDMRLSVADCGAFVASIEIDDLTQIFRFLDDWGIINYCAAVPSCEPQSDNLYLSQDSNGEVRVPSASLKSIDSLIQFDKPKYRLKAADVYPSLSCQDGEVSDLDSRIREQLSDNRCNSCSRPLPIVSYQSQKEVDLLLCLDCFHDGRYVIGHSSMDFMRVDSTKDYGDLDGESWTDQETLLLLEAVDIYNDNWNEIAEHIGTKSKAQCILHFVRLPMQDGPVENIKVPSMSLSSNLSNKDDTGRSLSSSNGDSAGSCLQDPDSESRLPFANSVNPVMSVIAFLASAIGPRLAATCAHASLAVLSEDSPKAPEHANGMNLESLQDIGGIPHGDNTNSSQRKEDNSELCGNWNQNGEAAPLSAEKVRAAAKAGLSAAATKAKLFADHEEREIQRLSANIVNNQLKRSELKLKHFAEVETLLMKECEQVERARQIIAAERTHMISANFGSTVVTSSMNPPIAGPSVFNSATNNRQQVSTGSSSQRLIPGFGNNQPNHPQFMLHQPQPMYGLERRPPLSASHPSAAAPNVMFNAGANAQPALSQPMLRPVSGASTGSG